MIKLFTLFISLFISCYSFAQRGTVEPYFGIGTYQMKQLKNVIRSANRELPFPVKELSAFSPFVIMGINFNSYTKHIFYVGFEFKSTGYQSYKEDYSGYFNDFYRINGFQLHTGFDFELMNNENGVIYIGLNAGGIISKLSNTTDIFISGSIDETYDFKYSSLSVIITPGIIYSYPIHEKYTITAKIMGTFDFGGILKDESGEKTYIKTSWTGLRLFISFPLFSKSIGDE